MKVANEKTGGISGEKPERKGVQNLKEKNPRKPNSEKKTDDKFSPGEPDDYNAEEFATD